jgi:hypothetical protein
MPLREHNRGSQGQREGRPFEGYELRRPPEINAAMAAKRWRELNSLLHSLMVLHGDLHDRHVSPHILRTSRTIVSASQALLVAPDARGAFRVRAHLGLPRGGRERAGQAGRMADAALRARKPLLVSDPAEPELISELRLLGAASCLTVPIVPGGYPWGAIQLLRPEPFHEEEAVLIWIYVMVLEEALSKTLLAVRFAFSGEPAGDDGLLDYGTFLSRLEDEVGRLGWSGRPLSVLRLDWRPVAPDPAGDSRPLLRAARLVHRSIRPSDLVAAGPQGELIVALPGANPGQAAIVAQTIRRNLVQSRVLGAENGVILSLRISSASHPVDGASGAELLKVLATAGEAESRRAGS